MERQKLLSEQARLADRGAAEMVLMYISASKGGACETTPAGTGLDDFCTTATKADGAIQRPPLYSFIIGMLDMTSIISDMRIPILYTCPCLLHLSSVPHMFVIL